MGKVRKRYFCRDVDGRQIQCEIVLRTIVELNSGSDVRRCDVTARIPNPAVSACISNRIGGMNADIVSINIAKSEFDLGGRSQEPDPVVGIVVEMIMRP